MIGHMGSVVFREILKLATIHFHRFFDQFPTNSGNDLLAPSVKKSREANTTGSRGSTQLRISFKQNSLGSQTTGLDSCNMSGGPTTDNQNIDIKNRSIFVYCRRVLGICLTDQTRGCKDRCSSNFRFNKVSSIHNLINLIQSLELLTILPKPKPWI